jgi:pyocin large subunit-like protein
MMLSRIGGGSAMRRALLAVCLLLAVAGCRGATFPSLPSRPSSGQAGQVEQAAAAPAKPGGSVEVDRERIAREAIWAPGQLRAHVDKHGREGPWASEAEYDASARDTIRIGTAFTYQDRESDAERLGFYHKNSNRFTGVTRDGRRITTQFKPDRGEAYVRGLDRSTYR